MGEVKQQVIVTIKYNICISICWVENENCYDPVVSL